MILALLRRIPLSVWFALAAAIAAMAAMWTIYDTGHKRGAAEVRAEWMTERAAMQMALAKEKERQAVVTTRTVIEYRDRVQIVKEKGDAVIKEIPVLVQSDCQLSGGFRVLHDAAAGAKPLPADPAAAAAAADPVEAVAFARTLVENYSICAENSERLGALQVLVKGLANGNP